LGVLCNELLANTNDFSGKHVKIVLFAAMIAMAMRKQYDPAK
jgi:hypothetical protein